MVLFLLGSKARKKREKIVKALKRKGLPKKKFSGRTKKQSRFAIATAAVKKNPGTWEFNMSSDGNMMKG